MAQVKGFFKLFWGKCIFMKKVFPCTASFSAKVQFSRENVNVQSTFYTRANPETRALLGFLKPEKLSFVARDETQLFLPRKKLEIRAYYDETAPISKQALFRNIGCFDRVDVSRPFLGRRRAAGFRAGTHGASRAAARAHLIRRPPNRSATHRAAGSTLASHSRTSSSGSRPK